MTMIKCECQTWKGSERCQKSKFALLQVYVPMESLINIFFSWIAQLLWWSKRKERKKQLKKNCPKIHAHIKKLLNIFNKGRRNCFQSVIFFNSMMLFLTELWDFKGNCYVQWCKSWSWACTVNFQGNYRKLRTQEIILCWWTQVADDQSDYIICKIISTELTDIHLLWITYEDEKYTIIVLK